MTHLGPSTKPIQLFPRPNIQRDHIDYGSLKTFQTFTADDIAKDGTTFGCLCVFAEDYVAAPARCGLQPHGELEMMTYIVTGELRRSNTSGDVDTLRAGDVFVCAAAKGIWYEENEHEGEDVHLIRIWSKPGSCDSSPKTHRRHYSAAEKRDKLVQVISPTRKASPNSVPTRSPLSVYTTLLSPGSAASHAFDCAKSETSRVFVHVVQTSGYNPGEATGATVRATVSGPTDSKGTTNRDEQTILREGDGTCVVSTVKSHLTLKNEGDRDAEVIVLCVS